MKILTVSNSPFNHTSDSKINASILRHFKGRGHAVSTAVWHHKSDYYMEEEDGKYYFDDVCEIIPIDQMDSKALALYEFMKRFSPDLVITIGDYVDSHFVYVIKRMYPHLFKWLAVLTLKSLPIHDSYREALDYIDWAIFTSRDGFNHFRKISHVEATYCPFRPRILSSPIDVSDKFRISVCSKNSQQSNLGSIVRTIGEAGQVYPDIEAYIHTNIDDEGDYDIKLLKERYDLSDCICFPSEFVSFYDGPTDEILHQRIGQSDLFIDCPLSSATGLSAFEAACQGAIPLINNIGALKDLADDLQLEEGLRLNSIEFLGEKEGILYIVSQKDLYIGIENMYKVWKSKQLRYQEMRQGYMAKAQKLDQDSLVNKIEGIATMLQNTNYSVLTVDAN